MFVPHGSFADRIASRASTGVAPAPRRRPAWGRAMRAGLRRFLPPVCAVVLLQALGDVRAQCLPSAANHAASPAQRARLTGWSERRVWKRISIGTFPDALALRNALDRADCAQGDLAEQILARPSFQVSAERADLDLVPVSARDLGIRTDTARLADIYARAERRGLRLAPPEAGPQLRLQYLDQPVGEVLDIAMAPLTTWTGRRVIFVLANGGAGLILIGQDVTAPDIAATTPFLFVKPSAIADEHCPACATSVQASPR